MSGKWFRNVKSEFTRNIMPYAGKPINYVEIGCWAGDSANWVAENVLKHEDSSGVGIDPYPGTCKRNKVEMNLLKDMAVKKLSPYSNWSWIFEDSKVALRTWDSPIDVLYIDGLHQSQMAMQDFVLAFPYLSEGSLVIMDDYGIGLRKGVPCVPETVAAILIAFEGHIEPVSGNDKQFAFHVTMTPGDDPGDAGLARWNQQVSGKRNVERTKTIVDGYVKHLE